MQLLYALLAFLIFRGTQALPTLSCMGNTSIDLSSRDLGDQAQYCTDHSPAAGNAIGQLCAGGDGPLIVDDKMYAETSIAKYDQDPHPVTAAVKGYCVDSGIAVGNGPPSDESDNCISIMWQLCAASIDKNSGVVFWRGKNKCQQWFITGWNADTNEADWYDLVDVSDIVQDPAIPSAA